MCYVQLWYLVATIVTIPPPVVMTLILYNQTVGGNYIGYCTAKVKSFNYVNFEFMCVSVIEMRQYNVE